MKKLFSLIVSTLATLSLSAQGWPAQYEGVMLQGFYWDSFSQSQWVKLEKQADELSQYFSLVWLPQSADCGGTSMGYDDLYWFPGHYNSSFGSEAELRSLIQTFKFRPSRAKALAPSPMWLSTTARTSATGWTSPRRRTMG